MTMCLALKKDYLFYKLVYKRSLPINVNSVNFFLEFGPLEWQIFSKNKELNFWFIMN